MILTKIRNFLIFVVGTDCTCADMAFLIIMFLLDSQTKLQFEMQNLMKAACLDLAATESKNKKSNSKKIPDKPPAVSTENMFQIEDKFNSLLSTIVMFIEQD